MRDWEWNLEHDVVYVTHRDKVILKIYEQVGIHFTAMSISEIDQFIVDHYLDEINLEIRNFK